MDSGRQSGHGRVVLLYNELCEKISGGSLATHKITSGVESRDLLNSGTSSSISSVSLPPPSDVKWFTCSESSNLVCDESTDGDSTCRYLSQGQQQQSVVNERRKLLDSTLSNYKLAKLKRKLSTDTQLVGITKEELAMKKCLVDQMERMSRQYQDSVTQLSSNIKKISNSIADGCSMLQTQSVPQQPMYPHQPMYTLQPYEYHNIPHRNNGHQDHLMQVNTFQYPPFQPCDIEDK